MPVLLHMLIVIEISHVDMKYYNFCVFQIKSDEGLHGSHRTFLLSIQTINGCVNKQPKLQRMLISFKEQISRRRLMTIFFSIFSRYVLFSSSFFFLVLFLIFILYWS